MVSTLIRHELLTSSVTRGVLAVGRGVLAVLAVGGRVLAVGRRTRLHPAGRHRPIAGAALPQTELTNKAT